MRYDITEYSIKSDKIQTPFCIALLADLHDTGSDELFASLKEKSPTYICIAGDIVNGYVRQRHYQHSSYGGTLDILHKCMGIAPTFMSLGNHERVTPMEQLYDIKNTDITILDDGYIKLTEGIWFGGLSAAAHAYQSPEYLWLSRFQKLKGYKILMSHRPEYFAQREPLLAKRPIDLILSGHAHGGQIRIGEQGLYAPGQGFFPKYTAGIHNGKYGQMVISRGLANTTWIPRIHNRPEIVYINISKTA